MVEYLSELKNKLTVTRNNNRRYPALMALALLLPVTLILFGRIHFTFAATGPTIDLNGAEEGINFSTTFTEDSAPKLIVATDLKIENSRDVITSAKARITNAERPDSAVESLATGVSVAGLTVNYTPASGELTVVGNGTIEKYEQALRSLTYHNTSQSPDINDRIVSITVSDGQTTSPPAVSTIAVVAVNDAPELNNSVNMKLDDINEDVMNSNGNSVTRIIQSTGIDSITDVDGDPKGLAVIEAGPSNGEWQYSIDGGTTWTPFVGVSNTSAVLLSGGARIRFVPVPNFNGSANFQFRAWDQSGGHPNGATGVDVSLNGGTTPFSLQSGVATIQILSVNDLPIIDLNGGEPGTDYATQFFEGGAPVFTADFGATIVDADHGELQKLTITLTNRPNGAAESLAADATGTSVTVVPYNPTTGQLIINGPASIANFVQVLRKITYSNTSINPATAGRTVTFVAFDGVDDGPTAITTIAISPPNNAPILDPEATLTLAAIPEDTIQTAGAKISEILASAGDPITDPDSGAMEGIAAIGASNVNGQWQYSTVNPPTGVSWLPVGVISDTAALLLSDAAWLRFVPAPDFSGSSDPLTFRAWDRTSGGNGQRNVDVSVNGGNTAFSVNTNTISINITPVNDLPLLGGIPTEPLLYVEDDPPLPLPGESLTLTDPDSPTLASATVELTNPLDGNAEWLLAATEGTGITATYNDGLLQLTGAASPAVYQQVLRSVTYRNTSQDPDPADRVFELSAADNQGSRPPVMIIVQVQPVNDPPELDLDGTGPNLDYATVFYINRGPIPIVAQSLVLTDPDNTTLRSATIRITNLMDGSAEILSADPGGTGNITSNYDAATGVLSLTGSDSVANYQRVLRTVTYDNNRNQPNTENRVIEFIVADSLSNSEARRSTVSLVVAPNVNLFMPVTAWAYRRAEEPNDTCAQAMEVYLNTDEPFHADDVDDPDEKYDWFYFDLPAAADVTVYLNDFLPAGQIAIYKQKVPDPACRTENLERIGYDGGPNIINRGVDLGELVAGRYFIWVIFADKPDLTSVYRLFIETTPVP